MERGRRFTPCAPENKFYSVPVREAVENNQVVKHSTFCSLPPRWVKYNLFFLEAAFKQVVITALLSPPSGSFKSQICSDHRLVWTPAHEAAAAQQQQQHSKAGKTQVSDHWGEKVPWNEHTNRLLQALGSQVKKPNHRTSARVCF